MTLKQRLSKISLLRVAITTAMGFTILSFQNMVPVNKPPVIRFLQLPSGLSHQTFDKISFSTETSMTEIRDTLCQLDNEAPTSCNGTVVLTNLRYGVHNFTVRSYDNKDNETIATYQWFVDYRTARK